LFFCIVCNALKFNSSLLALIFFFLQMVPHED
jgi:hypothetical protein